MIAQFVASVDDDGLVLDDEGLKHVKAIGAALDALGERRAVRGVDFYGSFRSTNA